MFSWVIGLDDGSVRALDIVGAENFMNVNDRENVFHVSVGGETFSQDFPLAASVSMMFSAACSMEFCSMEFFALGCFFFAISNGKGFEHNEFISVSITKKLCVYKLCYHDRSFNLFASIAYRVQATP